MVEQRPCVWVNCDSQSQLGSSASGSAKGRAFEASSCRFHAGSFRRRCGRTNRRRRRLYSKADKWKKCPVLCLSIWAIQLVSYERISADALPSPRTPRSLYFGCLANHRARQSVVSSQIYMRTSLDQSGSTIVDPCDVRHGGSYGNWSEWADGRDPILQRAPFRFCHTRLPLRYDQWITCGCEAGSHVNDVRLSVTAIAEPRATILQLAKALFKQQLRYSPTLAAFDPVRSG